MAKILIKKQEIFADLLSATGNIAQFGSMKAAAIAYSKDPDTIQALAAFAAGWTGAVSSGPPAIEDLNGLFYLLTTQLAYLYQTGIPEWNASATYYIGSLVNDSSKRVYMSCVNDNLNNALTDTAKWNPIINNSATIVNSLPYTVLNSDNVICNVATTTTEAHHIVLPTPSVANKGRIVTIKMSGSVGTSLLWVNAYDDSTIDGAASIGHNVLTSRNYSCDGTNWFTI